MSGGLKVGDVFVAVSASLGEFSKSMDKLLKDVERMADGVAKAMQEAADAVGGLSENLLAVSAVAGAAVLGAAEHCADAKRASDALTNSVSQLSVEVGRSFLPLVRELTQVVRTLTATWRGLGSETQAFIVDAVRQAAVVGVVGMAMSRALLTGKALAEGVVVLTKVTRVLGPALVDNLLDVAKSAGKALTTFNALMRAPMGAHLSSIADGLSRLRRSVAEMPSSVGSLLSSFRILIPQIWAIAAPVLAVGAAIGALVLLAGSIYDAWTDASTGVKSSVADIGQGVADVVRAVRDNIKGMFKAAVVFATELLSVFASGFLQKVKDIGGFLEGVARKLKRFELADNIAQLQNLTASGISSFIDNMVNERLERIDKAFDGVAETVSAAGSVAMDAAKTGLTSSKRGIEKMWKDSGLGEFFGGLASTLDRLLPKMGDPDSIEKPPMFEKEPELAGGNGHDDREYARIMGKQGISPIQQAITEHARIVRETAEAHARALAEAMRAAKDALKNRLLSAAGEVTAMVDAFVTGMTATGNPLGGVAAVLGEFLLKSGGFSTLMGMVTAMFQRVADILGAVLTPLQGLMGAVSLLLDAAIRPLTPILSVITGLLQPLVPVLVMVGEVFNALAPLLELFAQLVNIVLLPLRLLGGVVMKGLFTVLKGVALVIMGIVVGVGTVWNGIISAIQSVFRTIGEISIFGAHPFEFLSDWADELEGAKAPVDEVKQAMGELADMTTDMAEAKANERAETLKNTQALRSATEAFSNVPSAWRSAKAKWMAQDPQQGAPVPAAGGVGGSSGTPSTGGRTQAPTQQGPTVNQSFTFELVGSLPDAVTQAHRAQKEALARLGRSGVGLLLPIIPVGGG